MKRLFLTKLVFTIIIDMVMGQSNLIPNGSFEKGGTTSCVYSNSPSHYEIDNWLFRVGTFDWIEWPLSQQNCPSNVHFQVAQMPVTSSRYIGLVADFSESGVHCYDGNDVVLRRCNESISVALNLPLNTMDGKFYIFKGRFLATSLPNHIQTNNSIKLYLRFSTSEEWWKDVSHLWLIKKRIPDYNKTIINIPIEIPYHIPNQWVEIEIPILLRHDDINEIENNFNLTHFIIQGSDLNDDGSYLLIDDLELIESCYCIPEKFSQSLSFNVFPQNNIYCFTNLTPWYFRVVNATEIIFEVFNRFGEIPIYKAHTYDVNGLENTPSGDFQFMWNGIDNNGNTIMSGVYDYRIFVKNCSSETFFHTGFINVDAAPNPPSPNFPDFKYHQISDLNLNCCKEYKYFQNIEFYGQFVEQVNDFITAGENVISLIPYGPVIIKEESNVTYTAGNQINLYPGFTVEQGASFTATITPCDGNSNKSMMSESENNWQYNEYSDLLETIKPEQHELISENNFFSIHPNPFSDSFTISISQPEQTDAKIYLTDAYGRQVFSIVNGTIDKGQHSIDVSTAGITKGLYFCIMETKTDRKVVKVVKLE